MDKVRQLTNLSSIVLCKLRGKEEAIQRSKGNELAKITITMVEETNSKESDLVVLAI